jgi:hypothetical protein
MQAQKESYRQEKKRATKQLFNALTDPSVVIMADSLKVGSSRHGRAVATWDTIGLFVTANLCECPGAAMTNDHRPRLWVSCLSKLLGAPGVPWGVATWPQSLCLWSHDHPYMSLWPLLVRMSLLPSGSIFLSSIMSTKTPFPNVAGALVWWLRTQACGESTGD